MPAPSAIIALPVPSPENPSWLSALVRDPLLHFLLLGAGLFLLYGAFGDPPLPAGEVPLALLFFNLGVEIGQIAFVLLILALGASLRMLAVAWPRLGETLVIYGVGGIAGFWLIDRTVLMLAP